jgi:hypothetical protein
MVPIDSPVPCLVHTGARGHSHSPSGILLCPACRVQELAATKKNLREALRKVELLTQQVSIVEELQVQMVEQDELIAELEELIQGDKVKQVCWPGNRIWSNM